MVYPMTISDKKKDTASKNRNNKFILDALNGLMDGRQFMTTLVCKKQGIVHRSVTKISSRRGIKQLGTCFGSDFSFVFPWYHEATFLVTQVNPLPFS